MTDLRAIRGWSQDRQIERLGELGAHFRECWEGGALPENELLDEAVVLWLEVLRRAFPEGSPLERLHDLVLAHDGPTAAFGLMSLRFRETREMVAQYRRSTKRERERLKPQLVARGMI